MKKLICGAAMLTASIAMTPMAMAQRDTISIVGSSTVYPFSTVVAERFGRSSDFKTPKIESTGTGGGMKLFCAGVGVEHPDFTNASRAIKKSEFDDCHANGVTDIVEVKIGYDGIVLANSVKSPVFQATLKDIFLGLAKDVPNPDGSATLVPNPYTMWNEVDSGLPAIRIEVLGPPPTSGTRDAWVELAMEGGCKTIPFIKAMKDTDKKKFEAVCFAMREDGRFIEAGENDNLIVQKLAANPAALGIFGYSFLEQNADKVHGSAIEGIQPTFEGIADGSYPVSRPLFFYFKAQHAGVIPGVREYVREFTSEAAMGEDGYLSDRGLIPLPADEYAKVLADVKAMKPVKL